MRPVATISHGGALAAAVQNYGGTKDDWLDLSTGINPCSAMLPKVSANIWQALPDSDLMENCLGASHNFYNISPTASLVAAPGVQALIQLLPQLRPGAKAAIFGSTYGEYAHVFQALGSGCNVINSIDDLNNEAVVIVVNPNNPDGRFFNADLLLELARKLAQKGGLLVVDEAFCDLMPEISVAKYAGMRGLLVLKSFGKFFGLAGVRLGFAAGHAEDISILERALGPWAVSGPALVIGRACYSNADLKAKVAKTIVKNSNAQRNLLSNRNLKVIADVGLFHLVEHRSAKILFEGLAQQQILTRIFADNPGWLRLGLTKTTAERARLASALDACLSTL